MSTLIKSLTSESDLYFDWLCDLVRYGRPNRADEFKDVLLMLFYEVFQALIPNDDNRAEDGKALRSRYQNESLRQMSRQDYFRPCSLLEMIIAISERMAFTVFNPLSEDNPDTACCFWEIIDNLNLIPNSPVNRRIIDKLIRREYSRNGEGGLFPIRGYSEDQRKVEIWYQMMTYINQNL